MVEVGSGREKSGSVPDQDINKGEPSKAEGFKNIEELSTQATGSGQEKYNLQNR